MIGAAVVVELAVTADGADRVRLLIQTVYGCVGNVWRIADVLHDIDLAVVDIAAVEVTQPHRWPNAWTCLFAICQQS